MERVKTGISIAVAENVLLLGRMGLDSGRP